LNIHKEKGEQIWQLSEKGAQLISDSPVHANEEGLIIPAWQQLWKSRRRDGAVCNLVALLFKGVSKV
jgi:hypothetical protein